MRIMILAVAGVMVASPAMAADQFDLLCAFNETPTRYRIDTARGVACEDTCDRIWRMGAVSAGEIRLKDTLSNYPEELPETMTVNRKTGIIQQWIRGAGGGSQALCEVAPFSGFPAMKF